MKTSLATLILGVTIFGSTAGKAEASPDRWETLRAINWVENPDNHTRPGRHGELGPYQFRPATWRMHTNKSFQLAVDRSAADEVAVKHYEWLKRELERNRVAANPFNIAMAWNCGVAAVVNGRAPQASFNYAVRVTNLVEVLRTRSEVIHPAESTPGASPMPSAPAPDPVPNFRLEEFERDFDAAEAPIRIFPVGVRRIVVAVN